MEKIKLNLSKALILKILGLGLLIIPAVWALFVPGFYGASDDLHIAWLFEFHKTLMMGKIPPRFVPDLSFGFGYPLFNFVFPFPFYLSEIFHLLGLSLVDSIKTLFFISVPLSGIFMYYLLREFTSKYLSLVGAVLYIYTPYRAVDLYIRGAIGEIVSFSILPLVLLSFVKLSKTGGFRWVGVGAISLASLVLSHNITAYMLFPFLLLFLMIQTFFNPAKKIFLGKVILTVILGLFTSIYFWLPAIVDSNLMKYDTVFNFTDHFPTIKQLITPYWGYGASVPGPYDGMSFYLGGVNLAVLIIGTILVFIRWKNFSKQQKIILTWAIFSVLMVIFLMNHRSAFIWNNVPLLPYFQFPWRFLILTTILIPLISVAFDGLLKSKISTPFLIILILLTTAPFFKPEHFLGRDDSYFINKYIPLPVASDEYKKTQEEYLRLPKNTQLRPDRVYPRVAGTAQIKEITLLNDLDAVFTVESTQSAIIDYNKYSFPGWKVLIDGREIEYTKGSPFGQIKIEVPTGSHRIYVHFTETSFKLILDAISLASFLVSLMLAKLWSRSRSSGRLSSV